MNELELLTFLTRKGVAQVLTVLDEAGMRFVDIKRRTNLPNGTLQGVLRYLYEEGCITIEPSLDGLKVVKLIKLTNKGEEVKKEILNRFPTLLS